MGARTTYAPGTFSWVDLATIDAEAAKAFYVSLFGWETEEVPAMEIGTYTLLRKDGRDVGGLYRMPERRRREGMRPHWRSYVSVDDADDAAARARDLGATILAEPFDAMDAGRMALIADPMGADLALWEPRRHIGAGLVNAPGAMCWNDLFTADPKAAADFYGRLFGWTAERIEEADPAYYAIRNRGVANGGIMQAPAGQRGRPFWNPYFATHDIDATVAAGEAAGGRTLMGPVDVPAGRFAVLTDPQDAPFSLFQGELDP